MTVSGASASLSACPHGMPSPASCLDCMDETGLGAAPVRRECVDGSTPARYGHTTEDRWVCDACSDGLGEAA